MSSRPKTRAYHMRSRNGCATCKTRHIKCDEKRPACSNCETRQLCCSFQREASSRKATPSGTHSPASLGSSSSTLMVPDESSSHHPPQSDITNVSFLHLELYNHFLFRICPWFTGQPRLDEKYRSLVVQYAFKHHFLMYEVLGVAALSQHLESPSEECKALAAAFQIKAIAGLDNIMAKVDAKNCVAIILFAHLLAIQSFCDTFRFMVNTTFSEFLAAVAGSAHLLRGIDVVIDPFRKDLFSTVFGDFVKDAEVRRSKGAGRHGEETALLRIMLGKADISEFTRETYELAIVRLQRDFDEVLCASEEERANTLTAFAWLIPASAAYIQLIEEARPEALVILAHYAVVLHYRRSCWAVGNAGYTLLRAILSHLGRQWRPWLLWPQSQIGIGSLDITEAASL